MNITASLLRAHGYSDLMAEKFERAWPDGVAVPVDEADCLALAWQMRSLDCGMLDGLTCLLSEAEEQAIEDKMAPLREEYNATMAAEHAHLDADLAKLGPAYEYGPSSKHKAYKAKTRPIWGEYFATTTPIWIEFQRKEALIIFNALQILA